METLRRQSEIDKDYSDLFGMQLEQLRDQYRDSAHPNGAKDELMLHGPDLLFDPKTFRQAIIHYPPDAQPAKAMIRFGTSTSCLQFDFKVEETGTYQYAAKWQNFNIATNEWEEKPYDIWEDYATIMAKAVQWFAVLQPYRIVRQPETAAVESNGQGFLGRLISKAVRS